MRRRCSRHAQIRHTKITVTPAAISEATSATEMPELGSTTAGVVEGAGTTDWLGLGVLAGGDPVAGGGSGWTAMTPKVEKCVVFVSNKPVPTIVPPICSQRGGADVSL